MKKLVLVLVFIMSVATTSNAVNNNQINFASNYEYVNSPCYDDAVLAYDIATYFLGIPEPIAFIMFENALDACDAGEDYFSH